MYKAQGTSGPCALGLYSCSLNLKPCTLNKKTSRLSGRKKNKKIICFNYFAKVLIFLASLLFRLAALFL
jgi:hypothetical protein